MADAGSPRQHPGSRGFPPRDALPRKEDETERPDVREVIVTALETETHTRVVVVATDGRYEMLPFAGLASPTSLRIQPSLLDSGP